MQNKLGKTNFNFKYVDRWGVRQVLQAYDGHNPQYQSQHLEQGYELWTDQQPNNCSVELSIFAIWIINVAR